MSKSVSRTEYQPMALAINKAIDHYIQSRRAKIPEFVGKHFSLKGALQLNKRALSSDLYKSPINIFLALPYTILKATATLARKAGNKKIPTLVDKLPRGFETNVQKEVQWLIYTELLEIPYAQGKRKSDKDALLEEIINQPEVARLFINQLSRINEKSNDPHFRKALETNLREYVSSHTAAADLAGSIITLAIGATVFKQMTPGAMVTGSAIAGAIAQQAAISNFFLGSTIGTWYYSIFPASASLGLIAATTGTIMAAMAIVTSFSGVVTDPIQSKLGIHQKRLRKFIECVEKELKGLGDSKFEIKDHYVARIFDILDILKTAAMAVK